MATKWKRFGDSVLNYLGDYLVQKPYSGELLSQESIQKKLMENHQSFPTLPPIESYTTNSFLPFDEDRSSHLFVDDRFHLFGVYDGHVGSNSAQFLHHNLLSEVQEELYFCNFEDLDFEENNNVISELITEAFRTCDKKLIQEEKMSGATAIVACIDSKTNMMYIANTGNCKAVLGIRNTELNNNKDDDDDWITETLTFDHLADFEEEKLRKRFPSDEDIVENGKVKGLLDYSRTFGDALFKRGGRLLAGEREDWNPPYIAVDPEISILNLNEYKDFFLVLGSEGVWRNMSPHQVIPLVGDSFELGDVDPTVTVIGGILEIVAQRGMDFQERVSGVLLTPGGFLKMLCQDITISVIRF